MAYADAGDLLPLYFVETRKQMLMALMAVHYDIDRSPETVEVLEFHEMMTAKNRRSNDVFFACSLIDYMARKTKNRRADVVEALGRGCVVEIIELADVCHSDNIDAVSDGSSRAHASAWAPSTMWPRQSKLCRPIGTSARCVSALFSPWPMTRASTTRRPPCASTALSSATLSTTYYESPAAIFDAYKTGEVR